MIIRHDGPAPQLQAHITRLKRLVADLDGIAQGQNPIRDTLSEAPLLNGWRQVVRPDPCLTGMVEGHPRIGDLRPALTTGCGRSLPVSATAQPEPLLRPRPARQRLAAQRRAGSTRLAPFTSSLIPTLSRTGNLARLNDPSCLLPPAPCIIPPVPTNHRGPGRSAAISTPSSSQATPIRR